MMRSRAVGRPVSTGTPSVKVPLWAPATGVFTLRDRTGCSPFKEASDLFGQSRETTGLAGGPSTGPNGPAVTGWDFSVLIDVTRIMVLDRIR
jgi:hypothetical protein